MSFDCKTNSVRNSVFVVVPIVQMQHSRISSTVSLSTLSSLPSTALPVATDHSVSITEMAQGHGRPHINCPILETSSPNLPLFELWQIPRSLLGGKQNSPISKVQINTLSEGRPQNCYSPHASSLSTLTNSPPQPTPHRVAVVEPTPFSARLDTAELPKISSQTQRRASGNVVAVKSDDCSTITCALLQILHYVKDLKMLFVVWNSISIRFKMKQALQNCWYP